MTWEFFDDAEAQFVSDEFWYALNNGYITPSDLLKDEKQLEKLLDAISLVESFEESATDAGLLEFM